MSQSSHAPTPLGSANLTERLCAAVDGVIDWEINTDVAQQAMLCTLDLVGVALAGTETGPARIARHVGSHEHGGDASTAWGTHQLLSPTGAAFVNGVAAHALDYDDVVAGGGHPSTVVVPAALAVAEQHNATGAELLRAVVAGIETHALLGVVFGPSNYARGFHTTATLGAFGAAYAAGVLRGLTPDQMASALGVAGTSAAGLKGMFGTMGKPFHAGRAAATGVLAAALAAEGFQVPRDVLGMPQGFAATQVDPGYDPTPLGPPAGQRPRIMDVQFKRHASCYLTHASISALQDLVRTGLIDSANVSHILIAVPPQHLDVCAIAEPSTGLEAKFSLRFTAALALADRSTGIDAYTDDAVADPELVRLRDLVEVVAAPSLDGAVAHVTVRTKDGAELAEYRDLSSQPSHNLYQELRAKFTENVTPILGPGATERLADTIMSLNDGASARDVTAHAAAVGDAA